MHPEILKDGQLGVWIRAEGVCPSRELSIGALLDGAAPEWEAMPETMHWPDRGDPQCRRQPAAGPDRTRGTGGQGGASVGWAGTSPVAPGDRPREAFALATDSGPLPQARGAVRVVLQRAGWSRDLIARIRASRVLPVPAGMATAAVAPPPFATERNRIDGVYLLAIGRDASPQSKERSGRAGADVGVLGGPSDPVAAVRAVVWRTPNGTRSSRIEEGAAE